MITLYGTPSPNVRKVILMLEEVEAKWRLQYVNVWAGEQFSPEFLALNLNSKVPVLVDPDGPGAREIALSESGAILIYLAEKFGALLPPGGERYAALQWLMFQMAGVGPLIGQLVHYTSFAPGQVYSESRYRTEAHRLLDVLEKRLGERAWIGGNAYSIADISVFPWLGQLQAMKLENGKRPKLRAWLVRIGERPAAKRLAEHVESMASRHAKARAEATPDQLDKFFGRGPYAKA